jgi:Uma2 family endonuclease
MGRRVEKKRPATYADVVAAPEHVVAELIDGTLYLSPRPATPHARAALTLGQDLGGPFDRGRGGPGGWVILMEPELAIVGQTMVPDVAGWRRERMPEMPKVPRIDLAPDWVCEIRSPSTEALDRKIKMPKYAAARVPWLWLVDPDAQVLEAFRLDAERWMSAGVYSEDEKARIEPFDAIELDLAQLWRA